MKLECYVHLPAVSIEGPEQYPLCDGLLTHLPFDFWHHLDPVYPDAERKFERSRPVFYYMQAECREDEADIWLNSFTVTLNDLHLSLLLHPGHYLLPHPLQSCLYLLLDGQPCQPLVGPLNREWIVFGSPWNCRYDPAHLQRVDRQLDSLCDFSDHSRFPDLAAAIDVLRETAAVEFSFEQMGEHKMCDLDYRSGFIRCMALLEDILLPADKNQRFGLSLTKGFGTYLALMVNPDPARFAGTAGQLSSLYRLRSQLVHGELHDEAVIDDKRADFIYGRQLLSRVITGMMQLYKSGFSAAPLSEILTSCLVPAGKDALPDPDRLARLHGALFPTEMSP